MHPGDRDGQDRRAARVDDAPDTTVLESRLRHADGRWLWFEATVRAVRGGDGEVIERQAAIRLVEDRKRRELTVQRQRDDARELLAALDDGIQLLGPDEEVLEVNDKLLELLGITRDAVIGARPPYPWWPSELAEGYLRPVEERGSATPAVVGSQHFEREFVRADGLRLPVWVSRRALPGGRYDQGRDGPCVVAAWPAAQR